MGKKWNFKKIGQNNEKIKFILENLIKKIWNFQRRSKIYLINLIYILKNKTRLNNYPTRLLTTYFHLIIYIVQISLKLLI